MDRIATIKDFSWEPNSMRNREYARIKMANNTIMECECHNGVKRLSSLNGREDFYEALEVSMKILIRKAPEEFCRMYKELKLNSREFRLAKTVRNQEIMRLEELQQTLKMGL